MVGVAGPFLAGADFDSGSYSGYGAVAFDFGSAGCEFGVCFSEDGVDFGAFAGADLAGAVFGSDLD